MAEKKGGAEHAVGWAILGAVFVAVGWLIWHLQQDAIRNGIRWLRYGEMVIISPFVPDDYKASWNGQEFSFEEMKAAARNLPANKITNEFISALSATAMFPYIYVFVVLITMFAFWALFRGPGTEHRQKFDLNTLIKKQSNIFPIISPFIDFNPSNQPPRAPGAPVPADLPAFAEALSPEEWIVYNEVPVVDKKLDEEVCMRAFAKQLGSRWKGAKNLPPYKQIMLAAFCLKAARKRNDADALLGRLALCWSHKDGLNLKKDKRLLREARAVLSNEKLAAATLRKCNEHAWETTALMRALSYAREEGGVLAPAQFVWLRAHERNLWYPLNNMGRQSLHMEAIGAMAHFKAEKLAQRPIPRPKVLDAVKSLSNYMMSDNARVLPQLDYSGSKKRGVKKLKTA